MRLGSGSIPRGEGPAPPEVVWAESPSDYGPGGLHNPSFDTAIAECLVILSDPKWTSKQPALFIPDHELVGMPHQPWSCPGEIQADRGIETRSDEAEISPSILDLCARQRDTPAILLAHKAAAEFERREFLQPDGAVSQHGDHEAIADLTCPPDRPTPASHRGFPDQREACPDQHLGENDAVKPLQRVVERSGFLIAARFR